MSEKNSANGVTRPKMSEDDLKAWVEYFKLLREIDQKQKAKIAV